MKFYLILCLLTLNLIVYPQSGEVNFEVYLLAKTTQEIEIDSVIKSKEFNIIHHKNELNFGLLRETRWLKLDIHNLQAGETYKLKIESITPDSIEVFETRANRVCSTFIGEAFPTNENYLNYKFKVDEPSKTLYLKVVGNGQPVALPMKITKSDLEPRSIAAILLSGFIVGIILFVLIVNFVFYIDTKEKLYLYFSLLNTASTGVILYFDGYLKLLVLPNSLYWNNQMIALLLSLCFLATNAYFVEFLEIRKHKPTLIKFFSIINGLFLLFLSVSFWHPTGFNLYIKYNLIVTSFEALLLAISVFMVRKQTKEYFELQLISVSLLIVFGITTQLYYFGFLPIHFLTQYSVHFMVFPQIILQTFALSKRYSTISNENRRLQSKLLKSTEQYSQNLINGLEKERKRLAGEFHDSIGQNLLVIRNRILMMIKKEKEPKQQEKLEGLAQLTAETLDEIRTISQNLRPTTLDTVGLTITIQNMMERVKNSTEIVINYTCEGSIDRLITKEHEINIYRILQELLNNIIKHSKASQADVHIFSNNKMLIILVNDNGIGFEEKITLFGNGLSSIHERLNIMKGKMHIESRNGSHITIQIPTTNE